MKHVHDKQTADLLTGKRPVGRPPKPDALTAAERSKRYRDAKREKRASSPGEEVSVPAEEFMRLKRMYWALEGRVREARAERDELRAKLEEKSNTSH